MDTQNKAAEKPRYHHGDLRAALLLSGEAELEEAGIEGFSLRRVAKRAGVSHAAPAHHFGDAGGLLTALAAEGFRLFLETQAETEAEADADPRSQLVAAGLGYVRFARAHPALFRLMFSSMRLDFQNAELMRMSEAAYMHLVEQVQLVLGRNPLAGNDDREHVTGMWSVVHGLADLMVAQRLHSLTRLEVAEQEMRLKRLIGRMLPP